MGVKGLWRLLLPIGRRISIETLEGQILAVDASIWMTQFVKAMRDRETGAITPAAHIIGFFRRLCRLRFHGIRPVVVFDGATPEIKRRELIARKRRRDQFVAQHGTAAVQRLAKRLLVEQLKKSEAKLMVGKDSNNLKIVQGNNNNDNNQSEQKDNDENDYGGGGAFAAGFYVPGENDEEEADAAAAKDKEEESSGERVRITDVVNAANAVHDTSNDEAIAIAMSMTGNDWDKHIGNTTTSTDMEGKEEEEDETVEYDDVLWSSSGKRRGHGKTKHVKKRQLKEDDFMDEDYLLQLRPTERKDAIEQARKKQRMLSRKEFMPVAANAQEYSQAQVRNFLRYAHLNKDIVQMAKKAVARDAEKEGGGEVLASDRSRRIIFTKDGSEEEAHEDSDSGSSAEQEEEDGGFLRTNQRPTNVRRLQAKRTRQTTAGEFTSEAASSRLRRVGRSSSSSSSSNNNNNNNTTAEASDNENDDDDSGGGFFSSSNNTAMSLSAFGCGTTTARRRRVFIEDSDYDNAVTEDDNTHTMRGAHGVFTHANSSDEEKESGGKASAVGNKNNNDETTKKGTRGKSTFDHADSSALAEDDEPSDVTGGFMAATSPSKAAANRKAAQETKATPTKKKPRKRRVQFSPDAANGGFGTPRSSTTRRAADSDVVFIRTRENSNTFSVVTKEPTTVAAVASSASAARHDDSSEEGNEDEEDEERAGDFATASASSNNAAVKRYLNRMGATMPYAVFGGDDDDSHDDGGVDNKGKPMAGLKSTGLEDEVIVMEDDNRKQNSEAMTAQELQDQMLAIALQEEDARIATSFADQDTLSEPPESTNHGSTIPSTIHKLPSGSEMMMLTEDDGSDDENVDWESGDDDGGEGAATMERTVPKANVADKPVRLFEIAKTNMLAKDGGGSGVGSKDAGQQDGSEDGQATLKAASGKKDGPEEERAAPKETSMTQGQSLVDTADSDDNVDWEDGDEDGGMSDVHQRADTKENSRDVQHHSGSEEDSTGRKEVSPGATNIICGQILADATESDDDVDWKDGEEIGSAHKVNEPSETEPGVHGKGTGDQTLTREQSASSEGTFPREQSASSDGTSQRRQSLSDDDGGHLRFEDDAGDFRATTDHAIDDFGANHSVDNAEALRRAEATAANLTNWAGHAMRRAIAEHLGETSPPKPVQRSETPESIQDVNADDAGEALETSDGAEVSAEMLDLVMNEDNAEDAAQKLRDYQNGLAEGAKTNVERETEGMTDEMQQEIIQLLQLFGVPYVQAPAEAEAQCVELERLGLVNGIITEDSDVFVFGGKTIYKNIFDDQKYVEIYLSDDAEREMGLGPNEMVALAMLLGGDYTEGVKGVGIVNGMEIVKSFYVAKDLKEGLQKFRTWLDGFEPLMDAQARKDKGAKSLTREQVFHLKHRTARNRWNAPENFPSDGVLSAYTNPVVDKSTTRFSFGVPDMENIIAFCNKNAGWVAEDTRRLLKPVVDRVENKRSRQTRIDQYMRYEHGIKFASVRSKRLRQVLAGPQTDGGVEDTFGAKDAENGVVTIEIGKKRKKSSQSSQKSKGKNASFSSRSSWSQRQTLAFDSTTTRNDEALSPNAQTAGAPLTTTSPYFKISESYPDDDDQAQAEAEGKEADHSQAAQAATISGRNGRFKLSNYCKTIDPSTAETPETVAERNAQLVTERNAAKQGRAPPAYSKRSSNFGVSDQPKKKKEKAKKK